MIGILVQLVISWAILWFFYKKDLSALGLKPTKGHMVDLLFGLVSAAICFTIYCLSKSALSNNQWTLNSEFTVRNFASSSWWVLSSVLFEELIFRGAVLYVLIRKIGTKRACIISAVAFGVYHWFSFGVLGNPIPMAYVFITTGFWGLMYALAFARTSSLYLPIGLHLGWNLFHIVVFSQGPLGKQLLINDNMGEKLSGLPSLGMTLLQLLLLPIVVYLYLRRSKPSGASTI